MTDPAISRRAAFAFWLKLGCISFGGPAGQIALMHAELVERRRWISEARFLHALNYCMLLPGPEAQQLATYLGWLMHRTWGGLVAGVLFILPSLLLLMGLSWLYVRWGHTAWLAGLFYGLKPAVLALIVHATLRLGLRTLNQHWLGALAVAAFVALWLGHWPFPAVIALAGLVGWLVGRIKPEAFRSTPLTDTGEACADLPPHGHFQRAHALRVLLVATLAWGIPLLAVCALYGWQHPWSQMGWFFTKTAWLTFGGAYAVLPYVHQGVVQHYGWLSAPQMLDGLALGESTPGPLIMVVAFVGYLTGYGQALLGPEAQVAAGLLAACWVTWFTFLPSFLLVLLGGPLIERTHGRLGFVAPLTAIRAAIIGVMAQLAVIYAQPVLWPTHRPDGLAIGLALLAGIALWRRCPIVPLLLSCGVLGYALH